VTAQIWDSGAGGRSGSESSPKAAAADRRPGDDDLAAVQAQRRLLVDARQVHRFELDGNDEVLLDDVGLLDAYLPDPCGRHISYELELDEATRESRIST
jgi:hypothetical protein